MNDKTKSPSARLAGVAVGLTPTRRTLLLAAGGGLLASLSQAQSAPADVAPAVAAPTDAAADATAAGVAATTPVAAVPAQAPAPLDGAVVLGPIALAILHHARGDRNWSSRRTIRAHLRNGSPGSLFGIEAMDSSLSANWAPEARNITEAWQVLISATDPFQRARSFDKLTAVVDAYAAKILNADLHYLPLNGQGFVSYDYLDEELLNDSGLVEPNGRFATLRFRTLEPGVVGAIEIVNLHVKQLTPGLRGVVELYHVPMSDTVLAERLLKDKASTCQLLQVKLSGNGRCVPHGDALRGVSHPLAAVAEEFTVCDAAGAKLHAQALSDLLGRAYCGRSTSKGKSKKK